MSTETEKQDPSASGGPYAEDPVDDQQYLEHLQYLEDLQAEMADYAYEPSWWTYYGYDIAHGLIFLLVLVAVLWWVQRRGTGQVQAVQDRAEEQQAQYQQEMRDITEESLRLQREGNDLLREMRDALHHRREGG